MTHYNIQINIQRVEAIEPEKQSTYRTSLVSEPKKVEKRVINVLELKVTADSEADAYAKAHRMLNANYVEPEPEVHLHRASCDDSGGNRVCGFPDGPSIASPRGPQA